MKITVLSLFDGMSCGQIALKRAGIEVGEYYASEIKPSAIKVTQENFPDTIQLGDVAKVRGKDLPQVDLLIGGSPCQNLSQAMNVKHRNGLRGEKSKLFFEYYRLLNEIRPKYFLLENVGGMPNRDKAIITKLMGANAIRMNSCLVSAQLRDRLYWTNIPDIQQPENKYIYLNSILDGGWSNRDKARSLLEGDSRPLTTPVKMFHKYYSTGFTTVIFLNKEHYNACREHYRKHFEGLSAKEIDRKMENVDISVYDGIRYMNQRELEICQTVPIGYTSCLTRNKAAGLLGDGWTVDVISHIFNGLHKSQKKEGK